MHDLPSVFVSLLANDWVYFRDRDIAWNGTHHEFRGVQLNAPKLVEFSAFVASEMEGFEGPEEVTKYLIAAMNQVEADEALRVPRERISPKLYKAIGEGDLTGITLMNLAACNGAFRVQMADAVDFYAVLYDPNLARGIPAFAKLIERLMWDLRGCMRPQAGKPFACMFMGAINVDFVTNFLKGSVEQVPGAVGCPTVDKILAAPKISLDRGGDDIRTV